MCAAISVATFVHEAASFVRYSFNSGCSTLPAKRAHSVARSRHSRASLCMAAAPLIVRFCQELRRGLSSPAFAERK